VGWYQDNERNVFVERLLLLQVIDKRNCLFAHSLSDQESFVPARDASVTQLPVFLPIRFLTKSRTVSHSTTGTSLHAHSNLLTHATGKHDLRHGGLVQYYRQAPVRDTSQKKRHRYWYWSYPVMRTLFYFLLLTMSTSTNSCSSCHQVQAHLRPCPCGAFLHCSSSCWQQLQKEHACTSTTPVVTTRMIQAAVAFLDQQQAQEPLPVQVTADLECSFATIATNGVQNSEQPQESKTPQVRILGPRGTTRLVDWTTVIPSSPRASLPLRVNFDFYREGDVVGESDAYYSDAAVVREFHQQHAVSDCLHIPVPCRGDFCVRLQAGDRVYQGQLAYSTKSLLNPMPRSPFPGLMLVETQARQGDLERFQRIPEHKLLKLYVGDFVVHMMLKKLERPDPIHQDRRHRTMVYATQFLTVIPKTQAQVTDLPKQCLFCCAPAKLKCSVCGIFYCSKVCQKEDWSSHKLSH
jgi:hypothetical protein